MSHTHEIARPVRGEGAAVALDHVEPQRAALAHPQPAEREAVEGQRAEPLEAAPPLGGVGTALVDPEQRHRAAARAAQPVPLGESARRPVERAIHGLLHRRGRGPGFHQLVERHRDVGAEPILDADRLLGRQHRAAPVQMAPELHPRVRDLPQRREAHDLEAAAVGQDRARPAHELVQAAHPPHRVHSGTQRQMVGVREQDVASRRAQFVRCQGLDRARGADRQERRRQHLAGAAGTARPAGDDPPGPGRAARVLSFESERERHRVRARSGPEPGPSGPPGLETSGD